MKESFSRLKKYFKCRNENCKGKMNYSYCSTSQKANLCRFTDQKKKKKYWNRRTTKLET